MTEPGIREVAAAGGRARAAALPAERRQEIAQRAAAAAQSPAAIARRLARRWPDLSDDERADVRSVLRDAGVIE